MGFDLNLDNETFDFECPECGHKVVFKGKDIGHDVKCPRCKTAIHLDGKEFQKQLKDIENQINRLFK